MEPLAWHWSHWPGSTRSCITRDHRVVGFHTFTGEDSGRASACHLLRACRGTSRIRKRLLLGPYSRAMPRALCWSISTPPPPPTLSLSLKPQCLNLKPQCRDSFGGHNRNHVSGHAGLENRPTPNVESNNFRTFQGLSWARGRQRIRGHRFSVNF